MSACAAFAAGVLAVCCLSSAGGAPQTALLSAAAAPAASATSSSATGANPAEGHSPELTRELSGPLSGTGETQSGSALHASAALRQATTIAASSALNGIDISAAQHPSGAAINWADVAAAGYHFAAIKATEGNYYVNPDYASDVAGATAAGLYVAAYHFANPHDGTGAAQASYAYANAGDYKVGGQHLPLMLDLEYNPYPEDGNECYGLTPAQMVSWISSFMTEATTLTGAAPIIYTPANWWDTCTGSSAAFSGDVLWVPAYSVSTPGTLPAGWNTWTLWQYTSVGTVSGISGDVDLDYFSGGPQAEQTDLNATASAQIYTLNALAGQQVTYSATGLPPGLAISSGGLITGTATAAGTYQVTVTASTSAAALPSSVSFTWDVATPQAPAITSADQATFKTGVAGSFAAAATGYPSPTFSESGSLPAGVTFSSLGVLSGTPANGTGGVYAITITATNASGKATQAFALTVDQAPAITSADEATLETGAAGSFDVTATGYPVPALSESGALPSGVTLSSAGVLSGTPAGGSEGAYPITITASSSAGTATQALTLNVAAPAAVAVGVEGTNGALFVQAPQLGGGWHSLGGQIVGPPAVVAAPNSDGTSPVSPLFIATGTNKLLYIRSLTAGWQRVGPVPASCLGSPAAAITSTGQLVVACEGTNHALYYNTTTVPTSGLPSFTNGWKNLGGILTAGPAVAPVGGTVTFFVRGTTGRIYIRTVATGFGATSWSCAGSPAAAAQAATGVTVFACQGTNHALWEATNSGGGWSGAVSLGGSLIGGPAIAATSQQIEFFAEGTTHAVYKRSTSTGWASIGGAVVNGAGATTLN